MDRGRYYGRRSCTDGASTGIGTASIRTGIPARTSYCRTKTRTSIPARIFSVYICAGDARSPINGIYSVFFCDGNGSSNCGAESTSFQYKPANGRIYRVRTGHPKGWWLGMCFLFPHQCQLYYNLCLWT